MQRVSVKTQTKTLALKGKTNILHSRTAGTFFKRRQGIIKNKNKNSITNALNEKDTFFAETKRNTFFSYKEISYQTILNVYMKYEIFHYCIQQIPKFDIFTSLFLKLKCNQVIRLLRWGSPFLLLHAEGIGWPFCSKVIALHPHRPLQLTMQDTKALKTCSAFCAQTQFTVSLETRITSRSKRLQTF